MNKDSLLESVLSSLEGVRRNSSGHQAKCPAHEDRKASLSITSMPDGGVRLKCFAGCTHRAICAALGVEPRDLTGNQRHRISSPSKWTSYPYTDESGELICEHVRIQKGPGDKTFLWRRSDGRGGWLWTLNKGWFRPAGKKWERIEKATVKDSCPEAGAVWFDDCRRVPYRLDVLKALPSGSLVIVTEGEKDVHSAESFGLIATTGGSAEDWLAGYGKYLRGLDVVVCADNDEAGRKFEARVAASCRGKAQRIRILRLPGLKEKGDLTDWAEAGGTRSKLEKLIEQAPDYAEIILSNRVAMVPTAGDDESDPPISNDPKREEWLRQIAANAGDVIEATWLFLRMLNIKGKHSRIVTALIALARSQSRDDHGVNLGLIRAYHSQIHGEYEIDRQDWKDDDAREKSNRVSRDLRRFIDACTEAGAAHQTTRGCFGLVDYWPGSPQLENRNAIPGRYRLNFLRFALLILDRAEEIGGNPREAREQAAREVALEVLTWVASRVAKLGDQHRSEDADGQVVKSSTESKLKVRERKRGRAIRALTSYAEELGGDEKTVSSALEAIKKNASINISISGNINMSSKNEDRTPDEAVASEIEIEYTLRESATRLRQAWIEQGLTRTTAIIRARSLLLSFIKALFAGSEFKRRKIKELTHSLVNEALRVEQAHMSGKNVGHVSQSNGAKKSSPICPEIEDSERSETAYTWGDV